MDQYRQAVSAPLSSFIDPAMDFESPNSSTAKRIAIIDHEFDRRQNEVMQCRLGAIAHDFNKSLQAIVSVLNLMQIRMGSSNSKDVARLMETALLSADKEKLHVRRLVDQVNPTRTIRKRISV
ncbi:MULTISPECIES: hypothetical protein [unclassified Bradyrhizobium]|uniref:hypothetical protein n=1 Tax=unclassified Bradyrhizobium TaxID=2631580 RepID=UPI001FFB1198|nr:hypothetical protein [Bradyrhizobium sp. 48]MCK1446711.1 hypothetical protein [Bradyrhizobium sp. 48]